MDVFRNETRPTPAPPAPTRRYLALWFPFLPAERIARASGTGGGTTGAAARDEPPLVLVEKTRGALRLVATDRRGAALGLGAGLTLADARARVPALAARPADPAADAAWLAVLAAACARFTPWTALDPPDGLVLDVSGCAHLFGGEAGLLAGLRARMAAAGASSAAALAGTPDAARALARFGPADAIVPPGEDARAVGPLPVAALGVAAETVRALARAGLVAVGDLAGRPAAALAARFGADLSRRLDRALGREDTRIVPWRPPPPIVLTRRFLEPVTRREALDRALDDLVAEAARRLEARGAGARGFVVRVRRADGAVRRVAVEAGRATRDAAAVRRLFRERLAALADPLDPGFGFEALALAAAPLEPLAPTAPALDGSAAGGAGAAAPGAAATAEELVDRLAARFGRDRVERFVARDTHDPEREAARVPALDPPAPAAVAWPVPARGAPPARPLRLFDPPLPIETLAGLPDGPPLRFRWRRARHAVARAEGPERIAPEWWRPGAAAPARDYYRVEDAEGRRFWLFREGAYGDAGAPPRWFLHGLFA